MKTRAFLFQKIKMISPTQLMPKKIRSFRSFADERSRILILGSIPGPEALRKREYYGFKGNHFWCILPEILKVPPPMNYTEKLRLLKENRIALWDVVGSCAREGASDSSIRLEKPNNIIRLIKKYPEIRTIFLNGKTAEKLFKKYFGDRIQIPAYYLPSTSPAHASIPYAKKREKWRVITRYLVNRNPWC